MSKSTFHLRLLLFHIRFLLYLIFHSQVTLMPFSSCRSIATFTMARSNHLFCSDDEVWPAAAAAVLSIASRHPAAACYFLSVSERGAFLPCLPTLSAPLGIAQESRARPNKPHWWAFTANTHARAARVRRENYRSHWWTRILHAWFHVVPWRVSACQRGIYKIFFKKSGCWAVLQLWCCRTCEGNFKKTFNSFLTSCCPRLFMVTMG